MRTGTHSVQVINKVMRNFVNNSVIKMVRKISGEDPRVVTNHDLSRSRRPTELTGGLAAQIEQNRDRREFPLIQDGGATHTLLSTRDDTALLIRIDGP